MRSALPWESTLVGALDRVFPHPPMTYRLQDRGLTASPYLKDVVNLHCQGNQLHEIPWYAPSYQHPYQLDKLSCFPSYATLSVLDCSRNRLSFLPRFPRLGELRCNDNQLACLPRRLRVRTLLATSSARKLGRSGYHPVRSL